MKIARLGMTHAKCTRFLDVQKVQLAHFGVVGDREFVLVNERRELANPVQHAPFLSLQVAYDRAANLLELRYPDGNRVQEPVQFADYVEEYDYLGMRQIVLRKVLGEWGRRLSDYSGLNMQLYRVEDQGAGIDVLPVTLVTTGSLRLLGEKLGCKIDHRRFRANLVIEHDEPHIEDSWENAVLQVGSALLRVRSPVPRCLITQLDPESGEDNQRIVRALLTYREKVRLPDGLMPDYSTPGFASYAQVIVPGEVSLGDEVSVRSE